MNDNRRDWAVSETGGPTIEGIRAAQLLRVSKAQMYVLVERGDLKRAEARKKNVRRQPFTFFLHDIVKLALEYETISPAEAEKLLYPNQAAALVVAA